MTTEQRPRLSRDFWERLLRFVEWAPGWDGHGAEHIDYPTAAYAGSVAEQTLEVAPEPVVAPAGDGSLLLEWSLQNGVRVEVFVQQSSLDSAAVVQTGQVDEVPLTGVEDLLAVLREATARARR